MFAERIIAFAHLLRRAGMRVGPDRTLTAMAALHAVGLQRREDVHAALSAVMLSRRDEQPLFDTAFNTFWLDSPLPERAAISVQPDAAPRSTPSHPDRLTVASGATSSRRADAGMPGGNAPGEIRFDFALPGSEHERLRRADFETMTVAEFALAQRIATTIAPPVRAVRQRRREASYRGAIDLRATLRRSARDPCMLQPRFTRMRVLTPPIVVLIDVSGSMERYARMFLHYVHGLLRRHHDAHVFAFGTRLTNITRCLRQPHPDQALAAADALVGDWHGGTCIGACLDEFNRRWARRVLNGNAAVLIVTDGLERGDPGLLGVAAHRLARTAHEVVWLNPLLRYADFEPKAAGIRALRPHVDRFLPMYNLASLADLGRALRDKAPLDPRFVTPT